MLPEFVEELPSERDQNFEVRDRDGTAYVLKIAHPDEAFEVLDFQNKVLSCLAGSPQASVYPRVISAGNEELVPYESGSSHHWLRLLTFVEGVPLGQADPEDLSLWTRLGERLAQLDRSLETFQHPQMDRYLYWDSKHAPQTVSANCDYVESRPDRELLRAGASRFEELLGLYSGQLRESVIHNDANDLNLLVNRASSPDQIVGIIDFGDIVRTYTVCEIANAGAYAMMRKGNPIQVARHLIQGYHSTFRLKDLEFEVLYEFIVARLCLSVSNAARQKKLAPENLYLTVSESPAWELLREMTDLGRDRFLAGVLT